MADHVLPGYPVPLGGRQVWAINHAGPASYQPGGERFSIAPLNGCGVIDAIIVTGLSFNAAATATYEVKVLYPIGQGVAGASGAATVNLKWYAFGGAEVGSATALNAEFIRLLVIGG